jgi:purine-binding chemotaxis protein CheW
MIEGRMKESIHTSTDQIVVFTLDEQLFALPLIAVVKVIHAIEIRHLPKAPEIITGIINVRGRIIPVVDIRKRLGMLTREIDLNDRLIIADTEKREVAILVDSVTGIIDLEPRQLDLAKKSAPYAEHIRGAAKTEDGMILIYDLGGFLNLEEEKDLALAASKFGYKNI